LKVTRERSPHSILVVGVHQKSEGYPNVLYRLETLRESGDFLVHEINSPLLKRGAFGRALTNLPLVAIQAITAHLKVLLRLFRNPIPHIVYVPYPGIFLLNLLPKRMRRARVVIDAFISIHDTVVNDRKLLSPQKLLARLLYHLERRGYERADLVLVDTSENAEFLREHFHLAQEKVAAVPLSTNEKEYLPVAYQPRPGRIRVLFIGTFIHLHGISSIAGAIEQLRARQDLEFRIIGNGPEAFALRKIGTGTYPNVDWARDWQPPTALAQEIRRADICLGIFGDTAKAQRVCPLKLYAYAATGRAIVTAETQWVRNATAKLDYSPFATVPVADPDALANKIAQLADSPGARSDLAKASRRFYSAALSNAVANERFTEALQRLMA
jgi:glycosyltransferase involved in cell wall biosynthesis